MAIKNISYQRVLNLGDYNSKRLELFSEVLEGEDPEEAISGLMETVERKIREETYQKIESEISQLKKELHELKREYRTVELSLKTLQSGEAPDSSDDFWIPPDEATWPRSRNDGLYTRRRGLGRAIQFALRVLSLKSEVAAVDEFLARNDRKVSLFHERDTVVYFPHIWASKWIDVNQF